MRLDAQARDRACTLAVRSLGTVLDMDWKIELVAIPVTDVDRAKAFYVEQVGFHADHDYQVSDELRFVQLTPPGSACSIVLGTGITQMPPGSQKGVQCVVADVDAAIAAASVERLPAVQAPANCAGREGPIRLPAPRSREARYAGYRAPRNSIRSHFGVSGRCALSCFIILAFTL